MIIKPMISRQYSLKVFKTISLAVANKVVYKLETIIISRKPNRFMPMDGNHKILIHCQDHGLKD